MTPIDENHPLLDWFADPVNLARFKVNEYHR